MKRLDYIHQGLCINCLQTRPEHRNITCKDQCKIIVIKDIERLAFACPDPYSGRNQLLLKFLDRLIKDIEEDKLSMEFLK